MSDTQAVLPARPPYDSATAALLERIEPLGVFRSMTVQNIPSWRVPLDEVRAGFPGGLSSFLCKRFTGRG